MAIYEREEPLAQHSDQAHISITPVKPNWPRSILFAISGFAFIGLAGLVINIVAGGVATDKLIMSSEENSARNATVIRSMMLHRQTEGPVVTTPLTSESFAKFDASSQFNPTLLRDLGIVKLTFFDLDGETLWSSDTGANGAGNPDKANFQEAANGHVASILEKGANVANPQGQTQPKYLVRTYVPLRTSIEGPILGVMELQRNAPDEIILQIDDYNGTIIRTSLATLGGLFLILFIIVIAADLNLIRSLKRESILIEERSAEREIAHAELEEKNQILISESLAKTQILATVTHELKTPLTSIIGYADRLLSSKANVGQLNERQQRYIEAISESSHHLQTLINELLEISSIEAGKLEISFTDLDVGKKIEEIIDMMQTQFQEKQIGVVLNIPAGLRAVYGDEARFSQVVMNLLSNACKYSPAGTEIRVSGKEVENFVQIDVSDSGIGISKSEQVKLFTKFFRADNTPTRAESGTGLGLFIARQLMQAQGGEIWAQSEEGVGSTFSIIFQCIIWQEAPGV